MAGAPQPQIPDPEPQLAADAALELLKQLITLSSGALALSATFADTFRATPLALFLLPACWLALIASVLTALQAISAIVKSRLKPEHDWSEGYGKKMASISRYSFVSGLALLGTLAYAALIQQPHGAQAGALTSNSTVIMNNEDASEFSPHGQRYPARRPPTQQPCQHDTSSLIKE